MISITKYWETFKECIDSLPTLAGNEEYSKQLAAANKLIEIGVDIEKLGPTEIKQVVNQLHEKAKLFEYQVSFNAPKQNYTFYLPKITSSESLIFAIIYYQHLHNYHNVTYEGNIIWPFSNMVISGVNDKKITTRFQSKAMLKEIKAYCQSYNIALNQSQLLKTNDESVKEYIARVTKTFNQEPLANNVIDSQQPQESVTTDETQRLGLSFDLFKNQKDQLNDKIDSFSKKLTEFHLATQNYLKLNNEWNNTSVLAQFCYWIISWFYPVPQLQNLRQAKEQCIDAEAALNQEFFPSESAEVYRITLKNQLTEISVEFERTKEQLNQLKLEQLKTQLQPQEKNNIVTPNHSILATESPQHEDKSLEIDDNEVTETLSADYGGYYNFFNEHLPSCQTMQAAAVAAAAIVTQQLLYP
ncbi:Dot/Icm T4SS effector Lem19 [Legionella sp. WA2022007384]